MGTETRTRVALFALLTVGVVSFGQVVARGDYLGPALLGALLALALTMGLRRAGVSTLITILLSTMGFLAYAALIFQAKHTFYGLPTLEAARRLGRNLAAAWEHGQTDFAPVPPRVGYVIGIIAFVWLTATWAEIATFRWRRPLAVTLPSLTAFAFVLVVGTRAAAPLLVVSFLAILLTFWALASTHRLGAWGRWVGPWEDRPDQPEGTVAGLIARRMGVTAIVLGLLFPIALPSVGQGLLSWRSGSGSGSGEGDGGGSGGVEVDPFVSIAPRLLEQSEAELFKVRTRRAAYWKLVTLARFDGESWSAAPRALARIGAPADPIPSSSPLTTSVAKPLGQSFDLHNLGGLSLPAAGQARFFSVLSRGNVTAALLADVDSGDLRVEEGSVQSIQYSVTSVLPRVTYRQLVRAPVGVPPGGDYVSVPELSPEVEALLADWIARAGAQSPFEIALAIQDQLLAFEYNEAVEPGASSDYLTQFLLETRAGFCQQFATAFALLARSKGLPTRVAVGFLPGETDPSDPNLYTVRGTDAHAWPEVYFEDYGWIAFEPTPRAETARPRYTIAPSLLRIAAIRNGLTAPRAALLREALGNRRQGQLSGVTRDLFARQERGRTPAANPLWAKQFRRLTVVLLIVAAAFLAAVPLLKLGLTAGRYRRARTPSDMATAAFTEFEDDAADLAEPRRPAESAAAFAARLVSARRVARSPAQRLAALYEAAQYSASGAAQEDAAQARGLARDLRASMWESAGWGARLAAVFSAKRLGLLRHRL
ncbi:MAG TPA: transglutaminaseTgpA domain-containing protein [Actinomycetota bacterium]|nr:transglutaminaseTgpA domain-containing protein [Actinomycetota bacterium]